MEFIIDKRNYIILFIIIVLLGFIIFFPKRKPFIRTYNTHGMITITIYDKINEKKIDNNIKNICKDYTKDNDVDDINDGYDLEGAYIVKNIISLFEKEGIKNFIINENGNISAGKNYNGGTYTISINDPLNGDVLNTLKLKNESMATVNYEGNYDSTIVLHKDNVKALALSYYLSNKNFEEAKDICKKYSCEFYFLKDDETYMSEGFKKIIK
ncbi:MAG: FAD:protein FMN transferase [Bacilli bacterium]|nr:FAD:protein FMN transferase [Bacilli bacterium]